MSTASALKRGFIGIGDFCARLALRFVVTEEKDGVQFHGVLSPSIRNHTRRLLAGRPGPTLEIGCADGRLVIPFAGETDGYVVGLDLAPSPFCVAVDKCRELELGNLDLLRASGMALPFPDEAFGNVVCVNTLNSMPDAEMAWRIVAEMVRVCKPGGRIVVDYRNAGNPVMHYRFKWRRERYQGSQLHQITFRHKDVRGAIERLGCRVACAKPVVFPFRWLAPAVVVCAEKSPAG